MGSTNFTSGTVIASSWLNEVDEKVFQGVVNTSGTTRRTLEEQANKIIEAEDFGATGNGTTDDSASINAALLAVEAAGGGEVHLGPNRYAVASTIRIPDNCGLVGKGRGATELFLLAGSNTNLIEKKVGANGTRASLRCLALNGNDANNTSGGLYWVGPGINRGPSLNMQEVLVNYCAPATGSGTNGAVVLEGGQWGTMIDCDITFNQKAVGLWHKASDWQIHRLYLGPNGATLGSQNMIVQGGAGNLFSHCYFGGNGGLEQVLLWGSQRNVFTSCFNDNSWQDGYRLIDDGGTSSSYNVFNGGIISHASGRTDNTYSGVALEGAATGNTFVGISWIGAGHTSSGNNQAYAISEANTAGNNQVLGGWTDGLHQTAFKNLRAAGNSAIRNVHGFNPQGVTSITVGASPYTYTNQDHVPELVYIRSGAVSDVSKDSTTLATATGTQVWLEPGEAVVVTYAVLPTMVKDRK